MVQRVCCVNSASHKCLTHFLAKGKGKAATELSSDPSTISITHTNEGTNERGATEKEEWRDRGLYMECVRLWSVLRLLIRHSTVVTVVSDPNKFVIDSIQLIRMHSLMQSFSPTSVTPSKYHPIPTPSPFLR